MKHNKDARALKDYERALTLLTASGGSLTSQLAIAYRGLAYARLGLSQKRKSKSATHMRAVLEAFTLAVSIWEKGPRDHDLAANLHNLAALYHRNNQYAVAAGLYERALAIYEEYADPHGLRGLSTWNHLGATYTALGRFADAERILNYGLAVLPRDCKESSYLMETLAEAYGAKASALRKHAQAIATGRT